MKYRHIHIEETTSTNLIARDMETEDDETVVITTDFQTDGKGQGSNKWESEKGKNLLFSIITPTLSIESRKQFLISMAMANAIYDVLVDNGIKGVSIKWPNDIYAGNYKISGTLIENRLAGCVIRRSIIGVGLNVNQSVFISDAPNPTSMTNLTGKQYDLHCIMDGIIHNFKRMTYMASSAPDILKIMYMERMYRKDGMHRYYDRNGSFLASSEGVTDSGCLMLKDESGNIRQYGFKEVTFDIEF